MKIACIVGARPNFMKIAPILRAMRQYREITPVLVHTGQHYDSNLSEVFFDELGIESPDISLGIGSGTHGQQSGEILIAVEKLLLDAHRSQRGFDRMLVLGDVNSTMAATLAAAKLQIPVGHVESGLRSFDRTMPEEINRIVTDSICDMLFVSEPSGVDNLQREGHGNANIHLVGNVMIDTLITFLDKAKQSNILGRLNINPGKYGVATIHRPANVDDPKTLKELVDVLIDTSRLQLPLVFPIHPRTKKTTDQMLN